MRIIGSGILKTEPLSVGSRMPTWECMVDYDAVLQGIDIPQFRDTTIHPRSAVGKANAISPAPGTHSF